MFISLFIRLFNGHMVKATCEGPPTIIFHVLMTRLLLGPPQVKCRLLSYSIFLNEFPAT